MRTCIQSLTISVAAALLVGCGETQPPIGAPAATANARGPAMLRYRGNESSYQVLYSFAGEPEGSVPGGNLLNVNGTLYGTTFSGGTYNEGVAYSITTEGDVHVLTSFGNDRRSPKGPAGGLVSVDGRLYGAADGGSYMRGTIFSMTTSGKRHVIYSFHRPPDGGTPNAGLIEVNHILYGTTNRGGPGAPGEPDGVGTIFSITLGGTEKVLHTFYEYEGEYPSAGLIDVGGKLYGTTADGGSHGRGTVFRVNTAGTVHVLYNFMTDPDGGFPASPLIDVDGTLYGTTTGGGKYGRGTIFSISTNGTEHVLHSFGKGSDGRHPVAALYNLKGTLYGTTTGGGAFNKGTIFSRAIDGKEQTIHSFGDGRDGIGPSSSPIYVNGTLYGTTGYGGRYGNGTVYAIIP